MSTPKKESKRKIKRASRSESPTQRPDKRRHVEDTPDRPVGVTEKGLQNMLRTLESLKRRVDIVRTVMDTFTDEIQNVLDSHEERHHGEGRSLAGELQK